MRGILTGLALVAAGVLLAVSVDFGLPGQSLLGSLRFHIGLAALSLPIGLFIFGARMRGGVMLLVVLASLGQGALLVTRLHQPRAAFADLAPVAELRVISFNVLAHNQNGPAVVDYLIEQAPDIAIIMETPGIETYLAELEGAFPYRAGCADRATCDLTILSRLPLSKVSVWNLGPFKHERLVIVESEVAGQRFGVIGMHLSKPYFDEAASAELNQALFAVRSVQGPLILAGDFNAAPWSDGLYGFARATDLIAAPWHPATWPVELAAFGVPIDNMFTRGPALITAIDAIPEALGSNHLGLSATVALYPGD